jgi:16S rRNA G966 N2-methylase RsmD
MWKLRMRGEKVREWTELGSFESISHAARRVLELEDNRHGSLFFRVYVDPPFGKSDAEVLSRLEYQSEKAFYVLSHVAH